LPIRLGFNGNYTVNINEGFSLIPVLMGYI